MVTPADSGMLMLLLTAMHVNFLRASSLVSDGMNKLLRVISSVDSSTTSSKRVPASNHSSRGRGLPAGITGETHYPRDDSSDVFMDS